MPEVDPDDDSITRWVLHHYRFDPQRRQRRNVVVAAYDNEPEFHAAADALHRRVRSEIDAGTRDPRETVSGVLLEPGHLTRQARRRLVSDVLSRGIDPRPYLDGPLPSNVALFGSDADGPSSLGGEPPADGTLRTASDSDATTASESDAPEGLPPDADSRP